MALFHRRQAPDRDSVTIKSDSGLRRGFRPAGRVRGTYPRVVSPAEAVDSIGSGQQIYLHGAAATPSFLLDALVAPRR